MIDSRTKETNATQAPTNEGIKKENKSEPDTTSNWQEKRSRKKGLAVAIFAGFGVFLVYLFLLFENIRIYNDLRFSESPFSELNSLPKLTIHREEIGLDWQKNPCKPSSMICDAVPRWIPLTASDKTATQEQCSFTLRESDSTANSEILP
ncbi:Oidioi.mRNA.OKI2018_I69.chr1.g633.t1.cds [Oikopleura dioica]|uniref:Oidioi.mRNA.OKI2018_I69.chr1.g633.t1.cds n=1 Tax=Oikopleura dioica TaxID=34765 RepID=A0ABN7SPA8_OIKDI|nr:Oidioi.mRNA.OKI2018_I69.chr1.g633.t1.cds [Oikopleura dioica]